MGIPLAELEQSSLEVTPFSNGHESLALFHSIKQWLSVRDCALRFCLCMFGSLVPTE